MVGCAIFMTRRFDMDRGQRTLGVQNRVGGSEHGRYPDVEQADACGADAAQVPCVRSPNEQVPPPTGDEDRVCLRRQMKAGIRDRQDRRAMGPEGLEPPTVGL